jgi:phosphatidate cytidylyltransferase
MLGQRVITAVILLTIVVASLLASSAFYFEALVLVFIGAAAWEWLRLLRFAPPPAIGFGLLTALLALLAWRYLDTSALRGVMLAALILWFVVTLPRLARGPAASPTLMAPNALFCIVSLVACFISIATLYEQGGPVRILSVLVVVWLADIGGYMFGRLFGKHKLAPSISPGKSIEGAVGGLALVLLYGLGCGVVNHPMVDQSYPVLLIALVGWPLMLLALLILTLLSISGDLFESLLKREAGVKDSSNLLPGHGGVLDRIDALIPVLPAAALLLSLPA